MEQKRRQKRVDMDDASPMIPGLCPGSPRWGNFFNGKISNNNGDDGCGGFGFSAADIAAAAAAEEEDNNIATRLGESCCVSDDEGARSSSVGGSSSSRTRRKEAAGAAAASPIRRTPTRSLSFSVGFTPGKSANPNRYNSNQLLLL